MRRTVRPSRAPARAWLLVLLVPLLAHCATLRAPTPRVDATRTVAPATAPQDGRVATDRDLQWLVDPYPHASGPAWLGADVASSIQLSENRFAWIFGDTLLGSVSDECADGRIYCERTIAPDEADAMIRNTVGIAQRLPDGSFTRVVKYWRVVDGAPAAIFEAENPTEFYWPLAGVRVGPVLLIAANKNTPQSGLAPVANVLLRVENPDARPDEWSYTAHPVSSFVPPGPNGGGLSWTTALVPIGGHVYIVGLFGTGADTWTVLARVDADEVLDPAWVPALEYLQRDARDRLVWTKQLDPGSLHIVRGLPGTSEASIDHDPDVGWYSYRLPPFGFDIHLYTAADFEGPWRDSGPVYNLPAPWSTDRRSCPDNPLGCAVYIAYAVKAHPELAAPGAQVLSYNVNLSAGSYREAEEAASRVHGFYVPQMLVGPEGPILQD